MLVRALLAVFCFSLAAQEDPSAAIPRLIASGNTSYLQGDYSAAYESFSHAWDLAQQLAPESPLRYDVLKRLTAVRTAQGNFEDADNYLRSAILWRENTLQPSDAAMAQDILLEADLQRAMKDYGRAYIALTRVLAIHAKASGFDSTVVADDYSRLAQVQLEQQKVPDAISSLNQALQIRTKLAGPLDYSLTPDLDKLGSVYIAERAYENAEATYRHALVIRESLFGKEHPDLISTVDGLAYACFGQKKYDEAEPMYQRLIALWIKSTNETHPMVAIALDKVSIFYAEQKKYDLAKQYAERANAIRAFVLADGLSHEASEAFEAEDKETVRSSYQRAIKVLDPPNPVYDNMRVGLEAMMKSLDKLEPKKPSGKKK